MIRAKGSSSYKDGLNHSSIITTFNRRRNLIGNQLARRSNPRKSNINWTFKRSKWPDVIPKLINSFVNGVSNDFLRKSFMTCFKRLLMLSLDKCQMKGLLRFQ